MKNVKEDFIIKRRKKKMKFNLSDFLQLDTKELLAVNGGSPCSSSSGSPSDGSGAPSSSSTNSSDGGNGGGGNSNPSVTRNPNGTVVEHSVYVPLN